MGSQKIAHGTLILSLVLYGALLGPAILHGSFEKIGTVQRAEEISYNDLSDAIKIYFSDQSKIYLLLVNHTFPDWTYAVITHRPFPVGANVEIPENINQWYVAYWDYPFKSKFDKIIVSFSIKEAAHPNLEYEKFLGTATGKLLLFVSTLTQSFGPLAVFGWIFVTRRKFLLWSVVLIPLLYSIQNLAINIYALYSGVPTSGLTLGAVATFGLIVLLYITWLIEKSEKFQQAVSKAFGSHSASS